MILLIDGQGVLLTVWDFTAVPASDFRFLAGGPDVPGRHGDLASGVGLAPGTTEDFLSDGPCTILCTGGPPAMVSMAISLVGTNVDPDGDGETTFVSLFGPISEPYKMAFVDDSWPATSRVYDCAPIVGPDAAETPAGGARAGSYLPPCRDMFLRSDGSNVSPGQSYLPCLLSGARGQIRCDEALFGTRFCADDAFTRRTFAFGSPLLADQMLSFGTDHNSSDLTCIASLGRAQTMLPGIAQPFCLSQPWFRLPAFRADLFSERYEVNFAATAQVTPILAGIPLCVQAWYVENLSGVPTGQFAEPIAVTLR